MTPQEWLADFLEQGPEPADDRDQWPVTPAELAAARELQDRLAQPGTWADPPEGLLDRILADIETERATPAGDAPMQPPTPTQPPAPVPAPAPVPVPTIGPEHRAGRASRDRSRTRVRRLIGAGTAALALAAAVVIGVVVTSGPATTQIAMSGTKLAPAAHATAKVHSTPSGLSIVLDVRGLAPSAPGFYYQAWMKGPHGLVTIGTFHMRGGPGTVDLWSAVSLADYPTITVTREPEDGNPASSGQVVLTNHPTPAP
jgi:hypothetical protein